MSARARDEQKPSEILLRRPTRTKAEPELVHLAVLRDELWSPSCTYQAGWIVPLADGSRMEQVTCPYCKLTDPIRATDGGVHA